MDPNSVNSIHHLDRNKTIDISDSSVTSVTPEVGQQNCTGSPFDDLRAAPIYPETHSIPSSSIIPKRYFKRDVNMNRPLIIEALANELANLINASESNLPEYTAAWLKNNSSLQRKIELNRFDQEKADKGRQELDRYSKVQLILGSTAIISSILGVNSGAINSGNSQVFMLVPLTLFGVLLFQVAKLTNKKSPETIAAKRKSQVISDVSNVLNSTDEIYLAAMANELLNQKQG